MSLPQTHVNVTITLTMTVNQARDVMDDLLHTDAPTATGEGFSSDGSRDVYTSLSHAIEAHVL